MRLDIGIRPPPRWGAPLGPGIRRNRANPIPTSRLVLVPPTMLVRALHITMGLPTPLVLPPIPIRTATVLGIPAPRLLANGVPVPLVLPLIERSAHKVSQLPSQ